MFSKNYVVLKETFKSLWRTLKNGNNLKDLYNFLEALITSNFAIEHPLFCTIVSFFILYWFSIIVHFCRTHGISLKWYEYFVILRYLSGIGFLLGLYFVYCPFTGIIFSLYLLLYVYKRPIRFLEIGIFLLGFFFLSPVGLSVLSYIYSCFSFYFILKILFIVFMGVFNRYCYSPLISIYVLIFIALIIGNSFNIESWVVWVFLVVCVLVFLVTCFFWTSLIFYERWLGLWYALLAFFFNFIIRVK